MKGVRLPGMQRVGLGFAGTLRVWLLMQSIALVAMFYAISAPCIESSSNTTTIESRRPDYWGRARDDGFVISVTMQPTVLPLDMNSSNSIKAEAADFKPVTYWFRDRAMSRQSLAGISRVYAVPRTRTVPIVSSGGDWVIAEFFGAGSHIPKCRYEMLGTTVLTQYVLDKRGHVTRIADVGWQTDAADVARTDERVMHIGKHRTWIRVFDLNRQGVLQLVAAAWTMQPREPKTDDAPPSESELVFGSAQGKQRWTNRRRFETELGLDLSAQLISDGYRKE